MTKTLLGALAAAAFALPAAAQTGPSFDCARADGSVEQAICNTPDLAALDLELARLYALALSGPDMTGARTAELKTYQRGWIKGRNDCWKAADLFACVASSYGQRIMELRGYYDGARRDETGASFGPVSYTCDRLPTPVAATFINTPTSWVVVSWEDNAVMLPNAVSGSGARYAPSVWGEAFEFWTSHDEAMFTLPGQGAMSCVQPVGG